jgi:6-phosphofructokinase 1
MDSHIEELSIRSVSNILHQGGTMLLTARSPEFMEDAGVEKGRRNCEASGIDGLVVCGGDGSFRGARDLSLKGIPCIGIPCTIDNDIASSEYTIGFDTALHTAMENIDRLRDTSQSHDRCSVVEVMGRYCGDLAVHAGISCGALTVLVPEIEFDLDRDIIQRMKNTLTTGKHHFIIVVAEGVTHLGSFMNANQLAQYIEEQTGVESRATILGHIQRGGMPTAWDRLLASRMGAYAVDLLRTGNPGQMVVLSSGRIASLDIATTLANPKAFDQRTMDLAFMLSR